MTTTCGTTNKCNCPGCRVLSVQDAAELVPDLAGALFEMYEHRLNQAETAAAFAESSGIPGAKAAAQTLDREARLVALAARALLVLCGNEDPLATAEVVAKADIHEAPKNVQ